MFKPIMENKTPFSADKSTDVMKPSAIDVSFHFQYIIIKGDNNIPVNHYYHQKWKF